MVGSALTVSARNHPDATAVAFYDVRLTYVELNARACRLAQALASLGVGRGDRVAGLLHNSNQFLEAYFASAKLGALFVPMNFRLARPEVGRLLAHSASSVLIYGSEFSDLLGPLAGADGFPRHLVRVAESATHPPALPGSLEYESWIAGFAAVEPGVEVSTTDDQLIVYTSGTTGHPKGAVLTHANTLFSSLAKIVDFGLTAADRIAVFGPLFHVGPLMDLVVPTLFRGGTVVLGRSRGFDPEHLLTVLARERVTVVSIYPVMWRRLLAEADLDRHDLRSLRLLLTGGEPMPVPVLHQIYGRFPDVGFVNTYGSTEAGPISTFLRPEHRVAKVGSIGQPAFTVDLEILDATGRPVAPGEVGEIAIRSPFVCRGYWNRPEDTAAARRAGFWLTGDLGRRDRDGFLWLAGRKKDMIISGAENIYPVEVEQVIGALADVVEVAVIGVPDPDWGETVAAFVVRRSRAGLDEAAILEHCRANLAGYKKPRHIVFIEELPRTAANKVSREALRERFARSRP